MTTAPGDAAVLATARDHAEAPRIAAAAGALLVELRARLGGGDAGALKREGDRSSQELVARELAAAFPDDPVLSEEAKDDPVRLSSRRVWIVDPLDGTREFSEPPREDWAVHVALAVDGWPVVGAVAVPGRDLTLSTARPPALAGGAGSPLRMAVSRTRPFPGAEAVARRLGAELVPLGSAGFKVMAVLLGLADAYVHGGGQYEWDSAAPVAVALAAGLHASRLDGSPLRYNQPDVSLPDPVVCRPELTDDVLGAIERFAQDSTERFVPNEAPNER